MEDKKKVDTNINRTYFNFEKELKNNFKAATALKGKKMVEVFKDYMECFVKHPEKCIKFTEGLISRNN